MDDKKIETINETPEGNVKEIISKTNSFLNCPSLKAFKAVIAYLRPDIGLLLELGLLTFEKVCSIFNSQQKETIEKISNINCVNLNSITNFKKIKLVKDIANNALESVDIEKIDFLLKVYEGAIRCEDSDIEKLPIEQIVRIVRDISYREILFIQKYKEFENFLVVDKEDTSSYENGFTHAIYEKSDEAQDFWGLVSMGLLYTMPGFQTEYEFTKLGKNLISTLELVKGLQEK